MSMRQVIINAKVIVTLNGLDDYLKRLKSIQYLLDSSLIELENFQDAVVNDYR